MDATSSPDMVGRGQYVRWKGDGHIKLTGILAVAARRPRFNEIPNLTSGKVCIFDQLWTAWFC
jgi:hypothetical protein